MQVRPERPLSNKHENPTEALRDVYSKMQHYDQLLGLKHGDMLVCGTHGKPSFRFRCGPAPKYGWRWACCSCAQPVYKGRQGRVKKAYANFRSPKTLNTLRWAEAHELEGIKIRKAADVRPTAWDDNYGHADKNWKRHRRTQWKSRR